MFTRGGGGGAVAQRRSSPMFRDRNGKTHFAGANTDNRASYVQRDLVDAHEVYDGGVQIGLDEPIVDTPEKRLVAAVIEDAARILALKTMRHNEHLKRQAMSWVKGGVDSMPGFSFVECCQWMNLDEDYMRSRMLKLSTREQGIGRAFREVRRPERKMAV